MQASLPSFVRMVSVEDIGQGSDQMRILGVRWLPKGAAQHSVGSNGKLEGSANDHAKSTSGREDKGQKAEHTEGGADYDEEHAEGHDQTTAGGMEAEEGDFVNFQIAFAYRPTHSRKKVRERAKHAHLYLAFYLPGNIKIRKSFAGLFNALFPGSVLITSSHLGRAAWSCRDCKNSDAAQSRSTFRPIGYHYLHGTTKG